MSQMIETGEDTGELASMMSNLAIYYTDISDLRIAKIKGALQPVLLFFIYAIIAVMLLAIMLPMLTLGGEI